MDGIIALFILGLAYVLIFPIVLAVRLGDARRRIAHLEEQVVDLQRGAMQQGASPAPVAEATGARPVETAAEPRESGDERDEPGQAADSEGEAPSDVPGAAWGGRQPAAPPPLPERAPPPAAPKGPSLAARLAENWMIWVGGLALGLSAAIFGFFYAWVCSTMWGLDQTDPVVAITAMQAMNASVRNAVFAPAEDEVAWARRIIAAFEEPEHKGKGAITIDGRMVELLHAEMAAKTVAIAEAIAAREG